jgi:hypothetical protein
MGGKGNLVLDFLDVSGNRPKDQVDVLIKQVAVSQTIQKRGHDTAKRLKFTDIDTSQGGNFSLQVIPFRRRPVTKFIRILEGRTVQQSVVLPIDPDRVTSIEFPPFEFLGENIKTVLKASVVEGYEGRQGSELYDALDDVRKAGMLNIYAKMLATGFPSGRDTFSYVTSFTRILGDRFIATVTTELRDEVKHGTHTRLFGEASGAMHTPPPGFVLYDSFKTLELYGLLVLTFFRNPKTEGLIIEAAIDDANGVEHIFQVSEPALSSQSKNPYDIHEILLEYQKIDPGYNLIV